MITSIRLHIKLYCLLSPQCHYKGKHAVRRHQSAEKQHAAGGIAKARRFAAIETPTDKNSRQRGGHAQGHILALLKNTFIILMQNLSFIKGTIKKAAQGPPLPKLSIQQIYSKV